MTATFHVGDAIEVMSKLPEKSVDLILTSPPFLALRSYLPADHPDKALEGGSQSTPGEFIDWLLDVVEACDRVLAPHGSLCIELGDTYSGSTADGGDNRGNERYPAGRSFVKGPRPSKDGWPLAKSLSLIPESFRFAMVYGRNPHTGRTTEPWRLRNVIRWVRPNPPVGALGDKFRPATSELMVFCKSAKRYFDLDAVREPFSEKTQQSAVANTNGAQARAEQGGRPRIGPQINTHSGAPPLDWWNIPLLEGEEATRYGPKPARSRDEWVRRRTESLVANPHRGDYGDPVGEIMGGSNPLGAPPLDWWEIAPGGFSGAHYAVFPPELCVKPVKAMTPERVCRVCGEPSRRIVGEVEYTYGSGVHAGSAKPNSSLTGWEARTDGANRRNVQGVDNGNMIANRPTLDFSDCGHGDWRPGVVLDPFAGSGTTLAVATGHGRDAIGIDLDERNFDLALQRVGPFILERAS